MSLDAALALTALNERQIVAAFRAERAISLALARPLRDLGLNDSRALRLMVGLTIIRRSGKDRYFLDERVWAERRRLSGRSIVRVLVVVGLLLVGAAIFLHGR